MSLDAAVFVDREWRPSALIVAGTRAQGLVWLHEMGFEHQRATRVGGKSAVLWRGRDLPHAREAFFCGEWGLLDADALHRLWLDLGYLNVPITYVCTPDGEIEARKAAWFRWNAPSSNAPTRLHLLERAAGEPGLGPDELLVSACGLRLTSKQARESPLWHQEVRWGAPPGACGICEHELWKFPPGDFNSRKAALAMGAYNLATLRAQQVFKGVSRVAGRSAAKMEEFRRLAELDLGNLSDA